MFLEGYLLTRRRQPPFRESARAATAGAACGSLFIRPPSALERHRDDFLALIRKRFGLCHRQRSRIAPCGKRRPSRSGQNGRDCRCGLHPLATVHAVRAGSALMWGPVEQGRCQSMPAGAGDSIRGRIPVRHGHGSVNLRPCARWATSASEVISQLARGRKPDDGLFKEQGWSDC